MCGIFGYTGKGMPLETLVEGLGRLEYRGYDSCGIAALNGGKLFLAKRKGKIAELKKKLTPRHKNTFQTAILHTRWATHGKPSTSNAHPHQDCSREFAIVHNGIIENYLPIKEELIAQGHRFKSETDTEVIAHLLEDYYRKRPKAGVLQAVYKTVRRLEGSFALGIICKNEPGKLIGVRKGSPLIVGISKKGRFLASDIPALLPFTHEVVYLHDEQIAVLERDKVKVVTFKGTRTRVGADRIAIKRHEAQKQGFEHFMLKEIFEQPDVLRRTFALYCAGNTISFPQVKIKPAALKKIKKIYITACGTAYHAGFIGKYFLEKYCHLDVEIDTSSEFRYRKLAITRGDLLIAISQSGETADTLAAVREAKSRGAYILGVCNVLGSSLVKESDALIHTPAGPEIGVASTKAYTTQVLALFLWALYLARRKKSLSAGKVKDILKELKKIPTHQRTILTRAKEIKRIARKFSKLGCFLFLGRGINYPSALEGALKLKEISYVPAEGYPAGEMKHGPIALIDEYRAVVCIAPHDELYEKMVSNMQETKARRGRVFSVLNFPDKEAAPLSDEIVYIPKLTHQDLSPLLVAIPLQLFAYFIAKNLGCEIDQPRNLAKSVTVE